MSRVCVSLADLETELKKRIVCPYIWGKKQNNRDDKKTNFVYRSHLFSICFFECKKRFGEYSKENILFNYALNRWYNFWSAMAVEQIFLSLKGVTPTNSKTDREKDFFIDTIPFDHKTTVFPKNFPKSYTSARKNPENLVQWLYENQSTQNRYHLKNRIFVVLYDSKTFQHWKLKADVLKLYTTITEYMNEKKAQEQFISLELENKKILSAAIFHTV